MLNIRKNILDNWYNIKITEINTIKNDKCDDINIISFKVVNGINTYTVSQSYYTEQSIFNCLKRQLKKEQLKKYIDIIETPDNVSIDINYKTLIANGYVLKDLFYTKLTGKTSGKEYKVLLDKDTVSKLDALDLDNEPITE